MSGARDVGRILEFDDREKFDDGLGPFHGAAIALAFVWPVVVVVAFAADPVFGLWAAFPVFVVGVWKAISAVTR